MLEGVLKEKEIHPLKVIWICFNPWYVGGGVKRNFCLDIPVKYSKFQSLVCWRGC